MSFESYIKEYTKYLEDVVKETYEMNKTETEMLFEFVNNWIDLVPRGKGILQKEKFEEAINSVSGIILFNSWKLTNWISYEILAGKYFEAIRNMRFLFEGSVYVVVIEVMIEKRTFEKWGTLSSLSLKSEIFRLYEECRRKAYKKGNINVDKVRKIVTAFFMSNIDKSRRLKAQEYIDLYTEILANKHLYLHMGCMLNVCKYYLGFNDADVRELNNLWHDLSGYQHFSHHYLDAVIDNPDFCFVEKANSELLKLSVDFYFQTLDFTYAVIAWRFVDLREIMKKVLLWWKENFNREFHLTASVIGFRKAMEQGV